MKIERTEELVPVKFITIKDYKFTEHDWMNTLEKLESTEEDDRYGDYAVRAYSVNTAVADALVALGMAVKFYGEREAICYRKTDKFDDFYDEMMDGWE